MNQFLGKHTQCIQGVADLITKSAQIFRNPGWLCEDICGFKLYQNNTYQREQQYRRKIQSCIEVNPLSARPDWEVFCK